MRRLALSLLVLAGLTLGAFTAAGSPVVIRGDKGGDVSAYIMRWYRYEASGTTVVIDGECSSACVRFMSLRNVCATRRGYFLMHAITTSSPHRPNVGASRRDSLAWETPQSIALQERYGAFGFATVSRGSRTPIPLEPGVEKIFVDVTPPNASRPVIQVFLKVDATKLVPPCALTD